MGICDCEKVIRRDDFLLECGVPTLHTLHYSISSLTTKAVQFLSGWKETFAGGLLLLVRIHWRGFLVFFSIKEVFFWSEGVNEVRWSRSIADLRVRVQSSLCWNYKHRLTPSLLTVSFCLSVHVFQDIPIQGEGRVEENNRQRGKQSFKIIRSPAQSWHASTQSPSNSLLTFLSKHSGITWIFHGRGWGLLSSSISSSPESCYLPPNHVIRGTSAALLTKGSATLVDAHDTRADAAHPSADSMGPPTMLCHRMPSANAAETPMPSAVTVKAAGINATDIWWIVPSVFIQVQLKLSFPRAQPKEAPTGYNLNVTSTIIKTFPLLRHWSF